MIISFLLLLCKLRWYRVILANLWMFKLKFYLEIIFQMKYKALLQK